MGKLFSTIACALFHWNFTARPNGMHCYRCECRKCGRTWEVCE